MSTPIKRLTRSRDDKWIGGVCGGLATYSGIDATIIRIVVVAAAILGAGSLTILYVVAWALVPREESTPGVFGDQSGPTG